MAVSSSIHFDRNIRSEDHVANAGMDGWSDDSSEAPVARRYNVLRLGSRVRLSTIPSIPQRLRPRVTYLSGRLGMIYLGASTGEVWCRLNDGLNGQIWPPSIRRSPARTIPLNDKQEPSPTIDAIDLHPQMSVDCRDGHVGKLEGLVIESLTGIANGLLVQVRDNIQEELSGPSDPRMPLTRISGRHVMIPPVWSKAPEAITHSLGLTRYLMRIDATAAQVSQCLVLRDDGQIAQDVWDILSNNKAVAPYLGDFRVQVHDGTVTIAGPPISPRLRASVEQDIWHVSGVLNVRNLL